MEKLDRSFLPPWTFPAIPAESESSLQFARAHLRDCALGTFKGSMTTGISGIAAGAASAYVAASLDYSPGATAIIGLIGGVVGLGLGTLIVFVSLALSATKRHREDLRTELKAVREALEEIRDFAFSQTNPATVIERIGMLISDAKRLRMKATLRHSSASILELFSDQFGWHMDVVTYLGANAPAHLVTYNVKGYELIDPALDASEAREMVVGEWDRSLAALNELVTELRGDGYWALRLRVSPTIGAWRPATEAIGG